MLKKANKTLGIVSIFFSMIVLSPSIMLPSLLQTQVQPTMLNTKTVKSIKTMTSFDRTLEAHEVVKTEEWTNGTRFDLSEHIMVNDPNLLDVWVNCTTWRTPQMLERIMASKTQESAPIRTLSTRYPYGRFIDGLYFLLKGNNGTHLVSYDHNDNYDTYHPGEWYARYNLTGTQKTHVHLAKDLIDDWRNNVIDTADLVGTIFAILGGSTTAIGGVATVLGAPWVGVPAIIWGITTIIEAIIVYVYLTQLAQWIRDVVTEQFSGDGWSWMGAILQFIAILRTNLGRIYSTGWGGSGDCFIRFGKMDDFYEVRNWEQSWGAEGVSPSSSQDYTVAWWTHRESKMYRQQGR